MSHKEVWFDLMIFAINITPTVTVLENSVEAVPSGL